MTEPTKTEPRAAATEAPDPLVAQFITELPEGPRGRALLEELVADWRREAGDDADADDIIEVLEGELRAAFDELEPAGRLARVNAEVIDRRLRALSRRSWAAGQGLADGRLDDAAARAEGQGILAAAEALASEVNAVIDPLAASLRQALEDVLLEGLYLVEREAMSRRFEELFPPDADAPSVHP